MAGGRRNWGHTDRHRIDFESTGGCSSRGREEERNFAAGLDRQLVGRLGRLVHAAHPERQKRVSSSPPFAVLEVPWRRRAEVRGNPGSGRRSSDQRVRFSSLI